MITALVGVFLLLALTGWGLTYYVKKTANTLPDTAPARITIKPGNTLLVCAGDSITLGTCSHNYVAELEAQLQPDKIQVCNAGINADLSWNLLQRLDAIIRLKPGFITLLIGTNDVQATLDPDSEAGYMDSKNLPKKPDYAWFLHNMENILLTLRAQTSAEIAVITIPPNTEQLTSAANIQVMMYNQGLSEICTKVGVDVLDLFEIMAAALKEANGSPFKTRPMVERSPLFRYLLGMDWNNISEMHGLKLLIDNLHLNRTAGGMLATLIADWMHQKKGLKHPAQIEVSDNA